MTQTKVKNSIFTFSFFMILASLWMLNHPYEGLTHDARLYSIQALSHLSLEIFKNDLFLKYDSQENYTIFSHIYAYVIKSSNLFVANVALFITGHVLWFLSVWLAAAALYNGKLRYIALALAAAMPAYYGAKYIFSYGEPFLTPRIYAEAFVLMAIYFFLKNRTIWTGASLLLGFLMHPIMAVTGTIFLCIMFFVRTPKVALIFGCALMGAVLLLAVHGMAPFDRLVKFMDPQWADIVEKRLYGIFLYNWTILDFLPILASLMTIALYSLMHRGIERTIGLSLLIGTGLLLPVSMFLGDMLKNVLVLQLQLWRFTWLLLLFSYLALPAVYISLKGKTDFAASFVIVLLACWFCPRFSIVSPFYAVLLVVSFILILGSLSNEDVPAKYAGFLRNYLRTKTVRYLKISLCLIALVLLTVDLADYFLEFGKRSEGMSLISFIFPYRSIAAYVLMIAAGVPLFYFIMLKKNRRLVLFSMIFLLAAAFLWDRRLEYEKILDGGFAKDQVSLVKNLPIKSELLWLEFPVMSWFVANRASYISRFQGAGVVFSRETALLYDQRLKAMGEFFYLADKPFEMYWKHSPKATRKIYEKILTTCCRHAPDLDFIVAAYDIPEFDPLSILSAENVRIYYNDILHMNYKNFEWYLYNCKTVITLIAP